MYDKAHFVKFFKDIMKDKWTEEQIDKKAEAEVARYSTIIKESNAVHLSYYEGIIDNKELLELQHQLKVHGLLLSSFNKSGVLYNNLDDFTNLMSLGFQQEITKNIIYGVMGSAVWEGLKEIIKLVFKKTKGQTLNSSSQDKKKLTFGIDFSKDTKTTLSFRLDDNFSEKELEEALDKAVKLVKVMKPNEVPQAPKFFRYKAKKGEWKEVDIHKEILKKTKKRKRKE